MRPENVLLVSLVCLPALAAAEGHRLSLTGYAATDYMFRGVSQTDNGPALQLGLDYAHDSGLLAGLFFSNVDYDSAANREQDVYIGFSKDINADFGVDGYAWYYGYHGESNLNYPEYNLGAHYQWFDARYWYSDDYAGTGGDQHYLEASVTIPVHDSFSLGLRTGKTRFDNSIGLDDYRDYSLSLSTSYQGIDMQLLATHTDTNQFGKLGDSRLVLMVSHSFELFP